MPDRVGRGARQNNMDERRTSVIPRRLAWVWRDRTGRLPGGVDAVLVKAADGADVFGRRGYDYSADWRAWAGVPRIPWTWLGPPESSDGVRCADVLFEVTGPQPFYVVDVEEGPIPAGQITRFANRLRVRGPGSQVWFTSFPTRAQATDHGVPWDECVDACDGGMPQVYFASQRAKLDLVIADHRGKPVHVAVSPIDDPDTDRVPSGGDPGWLDSALVGIRHAGVSIWRYGLAQFAGLAAQLPAPPAPAVHPPEEDEMTPVIVRADGVGPLLVVFNGHRRQIGTAQREKYLAAGLKELNYTATPELYSFIAASTQPSP